MKKVVVAALALAGILFGTSVASAQVVASDSIKQRAPFSVAADHDGIDTDGYTLYINGAVHQVKPTTALVNGTVEFDFPDGLDKGTYVFYMEAFGPGGVTASSSLTLTVTAGNPSAPRNLRIIKK